MGNVSSDRNTDREINSETRSSRAMKQLRKYWPYYIMLAVPISYLLVFHWAPMSGLLIMFKDYKMRKGILGSPWLDPWYDNFLRAF